jgi:hypothetical protein
MASCVASIQDGYHVMWSVHILSTDYYSLVTDTDLRNTTSKLLSSFTTTALHFLFEILTSFDYYFV